MNLGPPIRIRRGDSGVLIDPYPDIDAGPSKRSHKPTGMHGSAIIVYIAAVECGRIATGTHLITIERRETIRDSGLGRGS